MSLGDEQGRMAELVELLRVYNNSYYALDAPLIGDDEYDRLFRELQALEERHSEWRDQNSPTMQIGAAPLKAFAIRAHLCPMRSLANAMDDAEFCAFDKRMRERLGEEYIDYCAEPKIDGLAISLIYRNGRLQSGITRGDGLQGEDVTRNVLTLQQIPRELLDKAKAPNLLEIRGEVFMDLEGFGKINAQRSECGEALFANPRNAAAGSLRQLDSKITQRRPLRFCAFGIGEIEGVKLPNSQFARLEWLSNLGLPVNSENRRVRGIDEAVNYYERLAVRRANLGYEIDGTVFKIDSIAAQESLGFNVRSPRWAIAWKYQAQEVTGRIVDIVVQVGRTGVLTPVAQLDDGQGKPVAVGGVRVRHASLHNEDEIRKKGIRIGDYVMVRRAGDVIPEVVRVMEDRRMGMEAELRVFQMPQECPVCAAPVERILGEVVTRCLNGMQCRAQLSQSIQHFASRKGVDIRGLGLKMVEALIDAGKIDDVADLYAIKHEDIAEMERKGEKSAANLIEALDASRKPRLDHFIYALGIREVGEATAQTLAAYLKSLEAIMEADLETLESLPDVGPVAAGHICAFFAIKRNCGIVARLCAKFDIQAVEAADVAAAANNGHPLCGKVVTLTGRMECMTRTEAKAYLKDLGAVVRDQVTSAIDVLIVGSGAGSKLAKGETLGIEVMDEAAFLQSLKKNTSIKKARHQKEEKGAEP
ncbi:MAG: NAD-dependent DNA ligase LigA [Candidatus Eutrophobiaceae bacterium]